jgi:molybdopterin synthase sulfur carrier subunit
MQVHVRLYASLARFSAGGLPGTPFDVDIPNQAALSDLVTMLKIPPEETKITFVNGIIHDLDWKLNPDDEVGIFPPIAGG